MATVRILAAVAVLVGATAARHAPPLPTTAPAAVPVAPPTIKAGVERWRAGDYAAAVAIWAPFAAAGDADALFNMGQAYKLGRGVTADAATARDYYRKAAIKGHLPAQANLGIALFQAGEKPEALKWLKTAADRGEARAQYVLGIAAFNGDGMPRSGSLGYGYLLRAQASGLAQATTALASITPGLSSADRTGGEAVAASLAAGSGVPAALAAATAPRLIPSAPPVRTAATLPIVTPPPGGQAPASAPPPAIAATAAPAATISPRTAPPVVVRPTAVATATRPVVPPDTGPATTGAARPATDRPAVTAAPRPAVPLREPTPAQADAAALSPRPAVATVDIPPSRPADPGPPAGTRVAAQPVDPLARAPGSATPQPAPSRPVARADDTPRPAAKPLLKPFEVAAEPTAKKADGWRVQLGAFSSRRLADSAWADVKATAAPARPVFATDGPVTKLQMGPFATRDAAKAACTRLTAAGRACFVTQG